MPENAVPNIITVVPPSGSASGGSAPLAGGAEKIVRVGRCTVANAQVAPELLKPGCRSIPTPSTGMPGEMLPCGSAALPAPAQLVIAVAARAVGEFNVMEMACTGAVQPRRVSAAAVDNIFFIFFVFPFFPWHRSSASIGGVQTKAAGRYLVCVSVVVLWVGLSEAQPEMNASATRARQETKRFFMVIFVRMFLLTIRL